MLEVRENEMAMPKLSDGSAHLRTLRGNIGCHFEAVANTLVHYKQLPLADRG